MNVSQGRLTLRLELFRDSRRSGAVNPKNRTFESCTEFSQKCRGGDSDDVFPTQAFSVTQPKDQLLLMVQLSCSTFDVV